MDRKILWVGISSFLLIGVAFLLGVVYAEPDSFRGTAYGEPYPPAPDFELKRADGSTFRLVDEQGGIVLLFFGYTSCPDVCPTTLAGLSVAFKDLGDDAKNVRVVFISVDPDRDSPEKIQAYVERFNPSFVGLTGSLEELAPVWQGYGVFREVVKGSTAMDYIINHTARVILVDSAGNMRLSYGFQTPPEDIAADILLLLGQ